MAVHVWATELIAVSHMACEPNAVDRSIEQGCRFILRVATFLIIGNHDGESVQSAYLRRQGMFPWLSLLERSAVALAWSFTRGAAE